VCHRSTTSCSTCRHFRQGVTARLGYCALDKRRTVLTGDEERACWERSAREGDSPRRTVPLPVAPWNEPDRPGESAESAESERETASAGGRGGSRTAAWTFGFETQEEAARIAGTTGESHEPADDEEAALDSDDLWSLYLAGPSPLLERQRAASDTTVRSAGMWVESHRPEPALPPPPPPLTARHKNGRSVRHRPWGAVPGREDTLVRSLRMPDRIRRPGR
jgi:hypothetical protein